MESTLRKDIDRIMDWIHSCPSLHLVTIMDVPIYAHVSLLFLSSLIIVTGMSNVQYTLITLGIGWMTSLLTSLNNYHVTRAVGGVIDKTVLWAPGGVAPATFEGVSAPLRLLAAISGPILLFPFFIVYFLLSGGNHIEFALGLIAPDGSVTTFHTVMLWATSLMMWLMAINFLYPLHPLTGFELLRHTIGRLFGKTLLVAVAFVIAVPMTAVFLWQGALYFNLLQIWIAIWGLPQLVQMALAIGTNTVDQLPFFAGEVEVVEKPAVPASSYGRLDEGKWDAQPAAPAPPQPSAKIVQMRINPGMKLPPGTYTIEDTVA